MSLIRIATYNIHKGVQGLGPIRRLEIHNLAQAITTLEADVVCLQEVRQHNRREARHFEHWPDTGQAEVLTPPGFESVYRTNAVTRHGEHGNALLSRWPILASQHEDMSDHRLEQRGLLHVELLIHGLPVHVVVVHLGLIRASRIRQLSQLIRFVQREIPPAAPVLVAGDFNDWSTLVPNRFAEIGLTAWCGKSVATFPSRLPLAQLDHVFARGLHAVSVSVPRGRAWWRMSDHLPLIAEFQLVPQPSG